MAGKKYQSCLVPFEDEIIALCRKRPPMPYSQIEEEENVARECMTADKNLSACVPVNLLKEPVPGRIFRVVFRVANHEDFHQESGVMSNENLRSKGTLIKDTIPKPQA